MTPQRSTPPGQHVPVLLADVIAVLDPKNGQTIFDGTVGWAGHAAALLERVGPTGLLVGTDFDPSSIDRARDRLAQLGLPFRLHPGNYAGVQSVLAAEGLDAVDMLLVDLGMSSMQVDDPQRGFSYVRDGPLDMRMDPTRNTTAADLLARLSEADLTQALANIGDEPNARVIATAIVQARRTEPITRTTQLSRLIAEATDQTLEGRLRPGRREWKTHPAARTFQVLRILVNRELDNLTHLLRVLPTLLKPAGRAAIISFHSGEDRLVKLSFKEGRQSGLYAAVADDPIRPKYDEQRTNPRSRSAKLRWARRA